MSFDAATYLKNRRAFPLEELEKYAGQWVAWAPDGSHIVAGSSQSEEALFALLRSMGKDPLQFVFDYIPGLDETILGGL
ncbi:MAG TPA: hypothetical protein VMF69_10880 [Gemmataceae bacterium]|nr:hypothetical protein [Gemmataceae bacterium]